MPGCGPFHFSEATKSFSSHSDRWLAGEPGRISIARRRADDGGFFTFGGMVSAEARQN